MKKIITIYALLAVLGCGRIAAQTNEKAQAGETFQLSTHILDIQRGKPAAGVTIVLFRFNEENREFEIIDMGRTDENGRIPNFLRQEPGKSNEGVYKLQFDIRPYFTAQETESIYPAIEVMFQLQGEDHYHIPITLSANGYSTYRGN